CAFVTQARSGSQPATSHSFSSPRSCNCCAVMNMRPMARHCHTPAHRASLKMQQDEYREATVTKPFDVSIVPLRRAWKSPALAALGCAVLASISGARAADVTYERLLNPEPHNWLMNHHDYSAQRFSPLAVIDKTNVKNLKLAFAVALGGTS